MQERLRQWTTSATYVVGGIAGSAIALSPTAAFGQVVPAADGTGTTVVQDGDRFDILDGTQAGNNLFHKFETLNIEDNQTANFLPGSDVLNIVGQVSGPDPSYIEGLVQVSGGANLYLINPQGVLFGPNAQLSLSGSLTATTSDQVGFGDEWLDVLQVGSDYAGLTDAPSAFRFTAASASAVVNQGDLSVQAGESLTFMGGNVVNEGRLEAPGGEIGLVSVGGESTVRFGIPGSLLSLDIAEQDFGRAVGRSFAPTDLPALLTGESEVGTDAIATLLTIAPNGEVFLAGTGIEPEEVAVAGTLSTRSEQVDGGTIALVGRSVDVLDATVDASGREGGTIFIGSSSVSEDISASEFVLLRDSPVVRAQGLQGAGGEIAISAINTAIEDGRISAQGLTQGGLVETSATGNLKVAEANIDAGGQLSRGRWLLNPAGIGITNDASALKRVAPAVIANTLDSGTDVEISTPDRDIALSNSIDQVGSSEADLTLRARRFIRTNGSTINLASTGDLAFEINPVNQLGGTSVQAAIAATENIQGNRSLTLGAGTYEFLDEIVLSTDTTIEGVSPAATQLVAQGNIRLFDVAAGSEVALRNLTLTTDVTDPLIASGGVSNRGALTVENSHFLDNRAVKGGAIDTLDGGTLTVSNSEFRRNNSGVGGGAISLLNAPTASISNTLFSENYTVDDGGALLVADSTVTVTDSRFEGNVASDDGGAVGIARSGSTTFNRVVFDGNTTPTGSGGAVNSWLGATVTFKESEAINNSARDEGGALTFTNSTVNINGSTIRSNTSNTAGGGIYVHESVLTLDNTTVDFNNRDIADNTEIAGGGLYLNGGSFEISNNSAISNNYATARGGGIYLANGTLALQASLVSSNRADQKGGGIYSTGDAELTANTVTFDGNAAGDQGGALFTRSSKPATVLDSVFSGNTAESDGGAIANNSTLGVLNTQNSQFTGNSSEEDGGAIFSGREASSVVESSTFTSNQAVNGGGIYTQQGTLSILPNSRFEANESINGGGILAVDSTLNVSGAAFDGNIALNGGGGGVRSLNSSLTLTDSTLIGNAAGGGGALDIRLGGNAIISDTTFDDNIADQNGGGIHVGEGAALDVETVTLNRNRAGGNGGGLYVMNSADSDSAEAGSAVNIDDALFFENVAGEDGGGLFQTDGTLTVVTGRFQRNSAGGAGGGVALKGGVLADLDADTSVFGNRATGDGGGLATTSTRALTVQQSFFGENVAGGDGGGLFVSTGASTTVVTSALSGNTAGGNGGGLSARGNGSVDVRGSGISQNGAAGEGGGVFVGDRTRLNISSASLNENTAGRSGGAVYQADESQFSIDRAQLNGNAAGDNGGAIANNSASGQLSIAGIEIGNNTAGVSGGAVYSTAANEVTLVSATLRNNAAETGDGGALYIGENARLTANETEVSDSSAGRSGGALFNGGTAAIGELALVDNEAIAGGAIANTGTLEAVNVTISGNRARGNGGGISTAGEQANLLLRNSTLTNNGAALSGGGIRELAAQPAQLLNTIVAGNNSAAAADVSGHFIDAGHNLIGQADGSTGFTRSFLVGAATSPLDPKLAPIAANGSRYRNHLPQADSPAINAGVSTQLPSSDQRGGDRVIGSAVDIGAIELTATEASADILVVSSPNQPGFVIASEPIPALAALPPTVLDSALLTLSQLSSAPIDAGGSVARKSLLPSETALRERADDVAVRKVERAFSQSYRDYWDLPARDDLSFQEIQAVLRRAQDEYQVNSAVIYATFTSEESAAEDTTDILRTESEPADDDVLQLLLITPEGELMTHQLPVTRKEANRQVRLFRSNVSDPEDSFGYRPLSQQMYQWLLAPLEDELAAQGIQNLLYSLDEGLRTVPVAAMSDDAGFSLERYGISVVPTMGLTQTDFSPRVRRSTVAMGVAEFDTKSPLPAVPVELDFVEALLPAAKTALNEGTTLEALEAVQALDQPGVLHLATHADFDASSPESSAIHLWNDPLSMAEFSGLDWASADLELLILSACSTALSSPNAELGFAGLATAAGVDATVGSLWQVSDRGTLALMSEFYIQLEETNLRFEALRRAQLSLLKGETRIQNGNLLTSRGEVDLPDEWDLPDEALLDHPFFWSAFTMVGNPW